MPCIISLVSSSPLRLTISYISWNDGSHESLSSTDWIPGQEYPVLKLYGRAVTPDEPMAAPLTSSKDNCFGQVSRALAARGIEPEAFTTGMRLLSNHFDRTDTTLSRIMFACLTGPRLGISSGVSRHGVGSAMGTGRGLVQGSHPTVGVAVFGQPTSGQLGVSSEELPVRMIFLLVYSL